MHRSERSELYDNIRSVLREDVLNDPNARTEAIRLFNLLPEDSEKSMYFRRKIHNRAHPK